MGRFDDIRETGGSQQSSGRFDDILDPSKKTNSSRPWERYGAKPSADGKAKTSDLDPSTKTNSSIPVITEDPYNTEFENSKSQAAPAPDKNDFLSSVPGQLVVGSAKGGTQSNMAIGSFVDFVGDLLKGPFTGDDPFYQPEKIDWDEKNVLNKLGESTYKYWQDQYSVIESAYPAGDIVSKPELLKSPKWWAQSIAQAGTSISQAVVYGGGTPAGGALTGSVMEAGPFYQDLKDKGDNAAMPKAIAFGTAVAALEKVGLDKIFKGASGSVVKSTLLAGLTEGATEWAEEPIGAMIDFLGKKDITPTEYGREVLKAAKRGVNVLPASIVLGGGLSAINTVSEKKMKENDLTPLNPLETITEEQLDNLIAKVDEDAKAQKTEPSALNIVNAALEADRSALDVVENKISTDKSLTFGAEAKVYGTKSQTFPARYAAIPRSMIQTSHIGDGLQENPDYPINNTRDYSSLGEQEKFLSVKNDFSPERHVTDSPDASVGPPMVGKIIDEAGKETFAVLGGNTRAMAVKALDPERQANLYNYTNERTERFGLDALQDPDQELIRYMGEFDLRKAGGREQVQKIVDALNPAPGKVQNLAEMAHVDAVNNVPLASLKGLTMDIMPAEAQQVLAGFIRSGSLDRNLRAQLAENGPQAAEYMKRVMMNAAYKSPVLADFQASAGRKNIAAVSLVESAVPALIEMRTKDMNDMADAFGRGMSTIVDHFKKSGKLDKAIGTAALQMETDPQFSVVNDVAGKLQNMIVRTTSGSINSDQTIDNFHAFFDGISRAVKAWQSTPDLFGKSSTPEAAVRSALAYWDREMAQTGRDVLAVNEPDGEYGSKLKELNSSPGETVRHSDQAKGASSSGYVLSNADDNVKNVSERESTYLANHRRLRELQNKIRQQTANQAEYQELEDLETRLGQEFMSFVQVRAEQRTMTFNDEVQTYLDLHHITEPAKIKGAEEYVKQVYNEIEKQKRGDSAPLGVAGRDSLSAGLRGSPAADRGERSVGEGSELLDGIAPDTLRKLKEVSVYLRDPIHYAPEIATALEEYGRISSIIPQIIEGDIPSIDLEGLTISDSADWAILNMSLRSPYAESMKIAITDDAGKIIHSEIMTIGTEDASLVSPRMVLRAVNRARRKSLKARNVYIAHNHPSGDPDPSHSDIAIDRTLNKILPDGIVLQDDVITNGKEFYSFKNKAMIPFAEESQAPWELVKRTDLTQITKPMKLTLILQGLRTNASKGIHVMYLTTRNKLTAMEMFAPDEIQNIKGLADSIAKHAIEEGAVGVLLGMPNNFNVGDAAKLHEALKIVDVSLVDIMDKGLESYKNTGLYAFREKQSKYKNVMREDHGDSVYDAAGTPDPAPIARRVPVVSGKGAKTGEWIKEQLGGLDVIRPLEMPELVRLTRELGAPTPRLKMLPKSYGYFRGRPGAPEIVLDRRIFRDPRLAAQVLSHEIGHFADFLPDEDLSRGNLHGRLRSLHKYMKNTFGGSDVTNKDLREELMGITKWWRPWDAEKVSDSYNKYRSSSVELYADALSVLLTAPAELKARAPRFFHQFLKNLDTKPDVKKEFFEVWDFLNQPQMERLNRNSYNFKKMAADGEELLLRKAAERELRNSTFRGWLDRFKLQYSNLSQLAYDRAQKRKAEKGPLAWDQDPEYLMDEHPLANNVNYTFMQNLNEKVIKPLEERGFGPVDIGEYLFFNRILNEQYLDKAGELAGRSVIANAGGITPIQARKQLLRMRLEFGLDDFTILELGAKKFQEMVFDILKEGVDAGIYSREFFETTLKPNKYNYATFATLDALEEHPYIPAGIREQVGTLKEGPNPFILTIIKAHAMIRLTQYNRSKSAMLDMLSKDFKEATKAKLNWTSGGWQPKPAPTNQALMMRLVDGKPDWYYVAEEVPKMFEAMTPAHQEAVLGVLNVGFRQVLYPLWITYNPVFNAYFNPKRDFDRTVRNMPIPGNAVKVSAKMLKEYKRNWQTAINRLKNIPDPLISEMLANFAIGSPYDSFVQNAYREDYLGKLMSDMSLLPAKQQSEFRQKKIIAGVDNQLQKIAFLGGIYEALPKISAYRILTQEYGWKPRDAAFYVRNYIGTPNYLKRGRHASHAGALVPFYNIYIRGMTSDFKVATDPRTRFTWWMRWAQTSGMFTILKVMACAGLLGNWLKDFMDGVSEYNKTNYEIVPLGKIFGGEFGKKSMAFRIPKDETSRLIDGLLYTILTGIMKLDPRTGWEKFTAIVSHGAGQVPGINPIVGMARGWGSFLTGQNPLDYSKGSPILTNDQWIKGGWQANKAMLQWTYGQTGLQNYIRYDPEADTTLEAVISATPLVNSMIKISDYGYRERQNAIERAMDRNRAEVRLMLPETVLRRYKDYNRLKGLHKENRTPQQEDQYQDISAWYHSEFSPTFDYILELIESGDRKRAKRVANSMSVD